MMNRLLRMLTTRCMTQAVYFSAGTVPVEQYVHFGLATPIYTHFTSPIRRYADVVVHRLLAASIGADDIYAGMLSQANVQKISQNINYRFDLVIWIRPSGSSYPKIENNQNAL
ncbi:hypothetical protein OESDEN_16791 [Oesophagostomum dentatum]|uniref:RNB domain-containing protein n=1 Tax=Oesophagostomum dentatum TaxID=61180 RepID=A0A0B1SJV1_OESDE|nr:hypothetical protein OESDEN_16791 [Oesophagostomum dentatum]